MAKGGPPYSHHRQRHSGTFCGLVNGDPNQYFLYTEPYEFDLLYGTITSKEFYIKHFHEFLLTFRPEFVPARAGRGVLLARLGKRQAAHQDAEECLRRDLQPNTLYQVAGVYALTSKQKPEDAKQAFLLLHCALEKAYGRDLLGIDPDLDPIREQPGFKRLTTQLKGGQVETSKNAGQ